MICKKCNSNEGTVKLRKSDYYCQTCFITNTNHKFRACIGRNKLFTCNERVLVCLSGGEGSTVLLDVIFNGLSLENHKKLRIRPFFLHVYNGDYEVAENIIKQCKNYDFNVYVVNTTDTNNSLEINTIPTINLEANKYLTLLNGATPTAYNDLFTKTERLIYIKYAKLLQCNFIFTAETTYTLASNLLCSISVGRGSQVENCVGFIDSRDETVKIVRPMKDISREELQYYIDIKKLSPGRHNSIQKNSLQFLVNNFVSDLQVNYPSTISTVCKTADKLCISPTDNNFQNYDRCNICKSTINASDKKLTALQATNFSRLVSLKRPNIDYDARAKEIVPENQEDCMFPYLNRHLCYSCSRNYSELNHGTFLQYIDKLMNI